MNVLDDIGFVKVVDHMGSDLTTVNSARVSYGSRSELLTEKDKKLIEYLAKNAHTSPFRHAMVTFHVKCPEFVARQWYKHIVGCNFSVGDSISHGWNEISGRYVEYEPEFYVPKSLRAQSASSKQASEASQDLDDCSGVILARSATAYGAYKDLIKAGVAKEQARMVLPFNTYTEYYWTASLHAISHFCKLRNHEHAQYEIQEYAKVVDEMARTVFPNSFDALMRH